MRFVKNDDIAIHLERYDEITAHDAALRDRLEEQTDAKMKFADAVESMRAERTALQRQVSALRARLDEQTARAEEAERSRDINLHAAEVADNDAVREEMRAEELDDQVADLTAKLARYEAREPQWEAQVRSAKQQLAEAQATIARLNKIAYVGEHHFPDLTYKARLEELVSQHRKLETERDQLQATVTAQAEEVGRLREVLNRIHADTLLSRQGTVYYVRLMTVWKDWIQQALAPPATGGQKEDA